MRGGSSVLVHQLEVQGAEQQQGSVQAAGAAAGARQKVAVVVVVQQVGRWDESEAEAGVEGANSVLVFCSEVEAEAAEVG